MEASTQAKKLALSPGRTGMNYQGCDAALAVGDKVVESLQAEWASIAGNRHLIPNFGKVAKTVEERALSAFDDAVQNDETAGTCTAQRAALQAKLRKAVWIEFLMQRQLQEEATGEALNRQLLKIMKRRGGPLRINEKIGLLQQAVASYQKQVKALLPEWAAPQGDPQQEEAEHRLGELQFSIESSPGGRALQNHWDREQARKLLSERAHGLSVSVDPGLRVMLRPEGLGNLQVFSTGPVGPPNQLATVNIGIMNDGSIADVYREHPVPPKVSVQPAVKLNLNLR